MYEALRIIGFFSFGWIGLGLATYGFLKLKHRV